MPYRELNKEKKVWKDTKEKIKNNDIGLPRSKNELRLNSKGEYESITNNFKKNSEKDVIHVRPHSAKRYYKFIEDEDSIGDNPSNGDELLDGTWMTKQCFWINNHYIRKQLKKELKGRISRKKKKSSR